MDHGTVAARSTAGTVVDATATGFRELSGNQMIVMAKSAGLRVVLTTVPAATASPAFTSQRMMTTSRATPVSSATDGEGEGVRAVTDPTGSGGSRGSGC